MPERVSGLRVDRKSRSPGERTMWSPRSQGRHGREARFDSNSSPPRSLQPRIPFACQANQCRKLVRKTPFVVAVPVHRDCSRNRSRHVRRSVMRFRWHRLDRVARSWPGRMIFGFPPLAAGVPRNPASRSTTPPPRPDSGVQISPRVAATPSCPVGGRDPGTVSIEIIFQGPGVEDHLIRAIRVDDDLNQPEIDQPKEHGRGRFLIAAITVEDHREARDPDLGVVEHILI